MFCSMFYSKLLLHNDLGGYNAESLTSSVFMQQISPYHCPSYRWQWVLNTSVLKRYLHTPDTVVFVFFILFKNLMHFSKQFLPCFRFSSVLLLLIKTSFTDRNSSAHHPYWKFLFVGTVLDVHEHTVLFYSFRSCTKKTSASLSIAFAFLSSAISFLSLLFSFWISPSPFFPSLFFFARCFLQPVKVP